MYNIIIVVLKRLLRKTILHRSVRAIKKKKKFGIIIILPSRYNVSVKKKKTII